MADYKIFRAFLISFLVAPFFCDLFKIKSNPVDTKIIIIEFLILLISLISIRIIKINKLLRPIIFIITGISLSSALYTKTIPTNNPNIFSSKQINSIIELKGKVTSISRRPNNIQAIIDTKETKILAFLPFYQELKINQNVILEGKLSLPRNSGEFNYQEYLKRKKIYYLLYQCHIKNITNNNSFSFKSTLTNLKENIEKHISQNLQTPASQVLIGLLTGTRSNLPVKVTENFKKLGLTHILAISGYNITLLINIFDRFLTFIGRKTRFWIIISALICFTIFVGAEPPVVRACIMGIINLFAIKKGHKPNLLNIILLSAFIMYLFDPLIITWDISFQLSFASTLGIVYISPFIQDKLSRITAKYGLRENLSLTLAAQITTSPISIINFKEFSILAPLANMIILPLIPLCMMVGFFSTITAYIIPFFKEILFLPSQIIIDLTIKIVEIIALIPISTLKF